MARPARRTGGVEHDASRRAPGGTGGRTGRRAGATTTRDEIAGHARRLFAERGYDGASIRMIATASGVDPALVAYFFGSKAQLFSEVLELPIDPGTVLPMVLTGPRDEIGARLAGIVTTVLDDPDGRSRVVALLRSASGNNEAAEVIRQRLTAEILEPVVQALGVPDAQLRAALVMSQVAGLTMAAHVVRLEALAGADPRRLTAILAGTLQRYLVGDLS